MEKLAAEMQCVEKGCVIFEEGAEPDAVYFVESGTVELWSNANGEFQETIKKEGVSSPSGGKQHFGEVELILGGNRRLSARAKSDCFLFKIAAEKFVSLIQECPDFENELRDTAFSRLCEIEKNRTSVIESPTSM
jgi:CRP-like cAMP-binding protein